MAKTTTTNSIELTKGLTLVKGEKFYSFQLDLTVSNGKTNNGNGQFKFFSSNEADLFINGKRFGIVIERSNDIANKAVVPSGVKPIAGSNNVTLMVKDNIAVIAFNPNSEVKPNGNGDKQQLVNGRFDLSHFGGDYKRVYVNIYLTERFGDRKERVNRVKSEPVAQTVTATVTPTRNEPVQVQSSNSVDEFEFILSMAEKHPNMPESKIMSLYKAWLATK